jgi:hypothetical protein
MTARRQAALAGVTDPKWVKKLQVWPHYSPRLLEYAEPVHLPAAW